MDKFSVEQIHKSTEMLKIHKLSHSGGKFQEYIEQHQQQMKWGQQR